MFSVKNISNESRKFRIHKTAEAFFLRPDETVIVQYPLIVERPDVFLVIDLSKTEETGKVSERKKKKINKEEQIND